jgi:hemerythrin-like domain-containing protein
MKRDERLVRLSREHTQALMLARRIEHEAAGADADGLGALLSDVIAYWSAGLLVHFRSENECLLARLVRHLSIEHEAVRRLQRDHLQIEALVITMRECDTIASRREALLAFGERLRSHVRWEEDHLFPVTEQALTGRELDALGADLAERLPEHPLPAPLKPPLPGG